MGCQSSKEGIQNSIYILLAHELHDLTQAWKKQLFLQAILSENSCRFGSCSALKNSYFSQLDINHVINAPKAVN
jgi:hypothetical protein